MRPPLTRKELDQQGCDDPTCEHRSILFGCGDHFGASIDAHYRKDKGVVVMRCSICRRIIAVVQVASGAPDPIVPCNHACDAAPDGTPLLCRLPVGHDGPHTWATHDA